MKNKEFFNDYMKAFLKQNSKLNLISKNDEKLLWEKHVFDSLAIEKFFDKYKFSLDEKEITLLDFGTGGGFPAVPISLAYPNMCDPQLMVPVCVHPSRRDVAALW